MKKIIVFLLLLHISIYAQTNIILVPYISYANYETADINDANLSTSEPIKSDTLMGIYSWIGNSEHSLELSAEAKYLKYKNSDKLEQINLTASYKTYLSNKLRLNTLIYYISNNIESDATAIALMGMDYRSDSKLKFGIEGAYSFYNSQSLANEVLQIKPYISYTYGNKNSNWGMLFPAVSLYYIIPYSQNIALDSTYYSTELALTHKKDSFTTKITYWLGEQIYAVRDSGFTVYNLNELHNSGTSISMHYNIDETYGMKASYMNEYYTRIGSANEESMNRILFLVDLSF